MTNTKTLLLAAVTALSLGMGTAMAQEGAGPMIPGGSTNATPTQPQSGSSDVAATRSAGFLGWGNYVAPNDGLSGASGSGG